MSSREKSLTITEDDTRLDVRLRIDKAKVTFFSINLSIVTDKGCLDVYRCDTAHGYPHEQKFWRDSKPIKLHGSNYNKIFESKFEETKRNRHKYMKWFRESRGKS